jgi:hypothetical protein
MATAPPITATATAVRIRIRINPDSQWDNALSSGIVAFGRKRDQGMSAKMMEISRTPEFMRSRQLQVRI